MYVIDLVGRLADPLDFLRYLSLFKYYGAAIRDGIDPLAFVGVSLVGFLLAGVGARLFERRDLLG
jgi:ABC-2 type transport system permease protein